MMFFSKTYIQSLSLKENVRKRLSIGELGSMCMNAQRKEKDKVG